MFSGFCTAGRASSGALECCCAALVLVACGCAYELPTYYGLHRLPTQYASVNGTDVLAGMFEQAGHGVYFRRTLVTTELAAADTIVWIPDDYAAPSDEVCDWFDDWLFEKPGRTLVYVGRDFDAAPLYWKQMMPTVAEDQKQAFDERQLDARLGDHAPETPADKLECQWFRFEPGKRRDVEALSGPWSAHIAAGQTRMNLRTKLIPAGASKRLLAAGDDPLVAEFSRRYWVGSRILLVTNGSFLLNLPLVNHEHRKLAGRLIESVGKPGRVVFLESGPGGPPIDPKYAGGSLWQMFGVWPLSVILLQLALAGVIFCFARWPIFGRPKQPPAEPTSDFAKHVDAVGQLLSRTKDRQFALARVAQAETARASAAEVAAVRTPPVGRPAVSSSSPQPAKGT